MRPPLPSSFAFRRHSAAQRAARFQNAHQGAKPPGNPQRGKDSRGERPGHPETGGVAAGAPGHPDRGVEHPRTLPPRAAAQNAPRAIPATPGAAVQRRAGIAVVPTVLDHLKDVAIHVIQTEGVRRKRAYGRGLLMIPLAAAAIAMRPVHADLVAPAVLGAFPPAPRTPNPPRSATGIRYKSLDRISAFTKVAAIGDALDDFVRIALQVRKDIGWRVGILGGKCAHQVMGVRA